MKTLQLELGRILAIKQRIGRLTNDFFCQIKKLMAFREKFEAFCVRNSIYEDADNMQILRWILALFVVTPILILIDYASVYLFIEALADRIPAGFGRSLIHGISIIIFFILELATVIGVLRIDEILEKHTNNALKVLKYVLMLIMIFAPAILIYVGYSMMPVHAPGEGLKTLVLMLVSIVIHTIFFLLMEDILHGINYVRYVISKGLLKWKNPEPRLDALKEQLRIQYNNYDIEMIRFTGNPDAALYLSSVELSKKEKFLKERLQDDIDDNDYEEFTAARRFTPKPPAPIGAFSAGSASSSFSSTVW